VPAWSFNPPSETLFDVYFELLAILGFEPGWTDVTDADLDELDALRQRADAILNPPTYQLPVDFIDLSDLPPLPVRPATPLPAAVPADPFDFVISLDVRAM
jgi:hypothetical protein